MGPHLAHVHENPAGTIGVPSHRAFERCRILTNSTSVHTADLGENLLVSSSLPSLAPMSTWKVVPPGKVLYNMLHLLHIDILFELHVYCAWLCVCLLCVCINAECQPVEPTWLCRHTKINTSSSEIRRCP